jgi:hypothetical protein
VFVVSIGFCCRGADVKVGAADALLLLLSKPTTPVKSEKSKSGRLRSPVFVSTGKYLSNSFCFGARFWLASFFCQGSFLKGHEDWGLGKVCQLTQSISSIRTSPPLVFPELDPANSWPLVTLFCRLSSGFVESSVCCW